MVPHDTRQVGISGVISPIWVIGIVTLIVTLLVPMNLQVGWVNRVRDLGFKVKRV